MNLAAESHVDRSIDGPAEFIQTNIVGTFTLLQEALRHWRGLDRTAQAQLPLPSHFDRRSLRLARHRRVCSPRRPPMRRTHPIPPRRLRPIIWCAPGAKPTACRPSSPIARTITDPIIFRKSSFPHIIIKGLADEPLPVYGDGQNVRDWLYVEDHAKALTLVLERGRVGETYNIGGRNERTNLARRPDDLRPARSAASPRPRGSRHRLISFVADRPGHDRRYAIDASKIENELGWRAAETFETGLAKTVHWYLENRPWWQAILDRGYKAERIGLSELRILEEPGLRSS